MAYDRCGLGKEQDGYYVDIQASEDGHTVTVRLSVGPKLATAFEVYRAMAASCLPSSNIEYIRFRIVADDIEIVLSRTTPSGTGDW
jgi:hypothetical protein